MVRSTRQTAPKFEPFPILTAPPPVPAAAPVRILPALTSNTPIRSAANGQIVTHFQPANKRFPNVLYEEFITDDYCVDRESVRRKFGWATLGNTHHIPVIYRNGDKYCAVRMVDTYIYKDYLSKISESIYYGCTNVPGYYVTIPETLLLNEINEFHCDNFYGTLPFKQNDVLVKLDEANNFYDFLTVVSNKLFNTPCDTNRCGFLAMNEKSLVPYVIVNDEKVLPLFYFDGLEDVKFKKKTVTNWNFSYFKFLFKMHGIREEFWKRDDCTVILLDELMQQLETGQYLTEAWPTVSRTNKTLFQTNNVNQHMVKNWNQHPITVLPVSTVKYSKVAPNVKNIAPAPTVSTNPNIYYRTISHS